MTQKVSKRMAADAAPRAPGPSSDGEGGAPAGVGPVPIAVAGLTALAVAMGIGRFAFTPVLPMMLRESRLSLPQGGWLASANYLGYLAGALSAVWIKAAPRVMVRAGLLLTGVLTLAMGVTHAFPAWALLRALAGAASAWVMVYASAWALAQLAARRRADLSGLMYSGVGGGIAVTGLLCAALARRGLGSAHTWVILGVLALLLSAGVWMLLGTGSAAPPPSAHTAPQERLRWTAATWRLTVCYGVFGFGYIIPATFLPVMARQTLHSPSAAGLFWPVFGMASAVSTLLAAALSRRHADQRLLAAAFALQAAGVAAPVVSPGVVGLALSALLVGGTFMVMTMLGLREARRLGEHHAGPLMAVMTAAFAAGQIAGPVYAAACVQRFGSFSPALLTAAAVLALSALILVPGRSH